jgi:F-type H+-transporting ATPase subunit b
MANAQPAASAPGSADIALDATTADHSVTTHSEVGTPEHQAEPAVAGVLDATVFVSLAMIAFIAILLWKKVPALITGGLDKQIVAIRQRLEEAKQLRAEAEALRDEYARKIADVDNQTRSIVEHAEAEAKALVAKAEADAAELVTRRAKMAEDKIAAAERTALADIRTTAANAAAKAAGALIAEKHGVDADKALVDKTIAGLGRLN